MRLNFTRTQSYPGANKCSQSELKSKTGDVSSLERSQSECGTAQNDEGSAFMPVECWRTLENLQKIGFSESDPGYFSQTSQSVSPASVRVSPASVGSQERLFLTSPHPRFNESYMESGILTEDDIAVVMSTYKGLRPDQVFPLKLKRESRDSSTDPSVITVPGLSRSVLLFQDEEGHITFIALHEGKQEGCTESRRHYFDYDVEKSRIAGSGGQGVVKLGQVYELSTSKASLEPRHACAIKIYDFEKPQKDEIDVGVKLGVIHTHGEINKKVYVVSELLNGVDCFEELSHFHPITQGHVFSTPNQYMNSLESLIAYHETLAELGYFSSDMKLENVFREPNGQLRMFDFGDMNPMADSGKVKAPRSVIATSTFLAPEEMVRDSKNIVTVEGSIWRIGLILIGLSGNGSACVESYEPGTAIDPTESIQAIFGDSEMSRKLCSLINHCFIKDPTSRITLAELRNRFDDLKKSFDTLEARARDLESYLDGEHVDSDTLEDLIIQFYTEDRHFGCSSVDTVDQLFIYLRKRFLGNSERLSVIDQLHYNFNESTSIRKSTYVDTHGSRLTNVFRVIETLDGSASPSEVAGIEVQFKAQIQRWLKADVEGLKGASRRDLESVGGAAKVRKSVRFRLEDVLAPEKPMSIEEGASEGSVLAVLENVKSVVQTSQKMKVDKEKAIAFLDHIMTWVHEEGVAQDSAQVSVAERYSADKSTQARLSEPRFSPNLDPITESFDGVTAASLYDVYGGDLIDPDVWAELEDESGNGNVTYEEMLAYINSKDSTV